MGAAESAIVLFLICVQLAFICAVVVAIVRIFQIHREVQEMKTVLRELMARMGAVPK
jgi:hypothetical protein